jgi:hypothetical protein
VQDNLLIFVSTVMFQAFISKICLSVFVILSSTLIFKHTLLNNSRHSLYSVACFILKLIDIYTKHIQSLNGI